MFVPVVHPSPDQSEVPGASPASSRVVVSDIMASQGPSPSRAYGGGGLINRRDGAVKEKAAAASGCGHGRPSQPTFSPAWTRGARLFERIVARAADPGFAPGIPRERFVVRRIVAARSLLDRRGRPLVAFARLARVLGEDEAAVRRWHREGIALLTGPAPCVPGGMHGLVVGRAA